MSSDDMSEFEYLRARAMTLIAKSLAMYPSPEVNSRRIAQLATVVAELVKHVASKEQP